MFDYTFNEVVDRVLEWIYELLTYNEKCYEEENMSFRDTIACKNKIASLREDEKALDSLSDRLQYNNKVKNFVNEVKAESKAEKLSDKALNEKSVNLIHNIIKKQKKGR